jgi:hypothetical protein
MNGQPTELEKIFANSLSDKDSISRIYPECKELNTKGTNKAVSKSASELSRQFSKEIQMANKYTDKRSASLSIKEMQIKMTLSFSLTRVKMAIIKKTNNNKCWQGSGERSPQSLLVASHYGNQYRGSSTNLKIV